MRFKINPYRYSLLLLCINAQSNPLSLCSSQNTGESGTQDFSTYNSYGSCTEHCSGYAFAIMLGKNCWCSNVMPSDLQDVEQCNDGCPGFQNDQCGNMQKQLYGYAQLGLPSSSLAASSSSTSTSSSTLSSETRTTSSDSTFSESLITVSSALSSVNSESTSSADSSTESSDIESTTGATTTGTDSTVTSTDTLSSTSYTQTSTENETPTSSTASSASATNTLGTISPNNKNNSGSGFWHSPGAVAGTFVGVGLGVLAIIILLLFAYYKRGNLKGMLINKRPDSLRSDELAMKNGRFPQSHSHTKSSLSAASDQDLKLVPIFDQRLDPTHFYMNWDQNGSNTSLHDNEDYSRRVLRVANPSK